MILKFHRKVTVCENKMTIMALNRSPGFHIFIFHVDFSFTAGIRWMMTTDNEFSISNKLIRYV